MPTSRILQRQDYNNDGTSTNATTIIIVVVVIFVIKICLIVFICYYRNKKRRERAVRGCTCFESSDYYCLPWWYWSSDRRCHCGAMNRTAYNAPPAYTVPDSAYPPAQYTMGPRAETGQWNGQQSYPMKPVEQVYASGQYHFDQRDY